MIKFANKIIIILMMIFMLPCCDFILSNQQPTTITNQQDSTIYGSLMKMSYIDTIGLSELDSIIAHDTLPLLQDWTIRVFTDFETNDSIYKYLHIVDVDTDIQIMYVITNKEEPFIIEKRIIE